MSCFRRLDSTASEYLSPCGWYLHRMGIFNGSYSTTRCQYCFNLESQCARYCSTRLSSLLAMSVLSVGFRFETPQCFEVSSAFPLVLVDDTMAFPIL